VLQEVEYGQPDLWTVLEDEDEPHGLPAVGAQPASVAAAGHPGIAAFLARECVRVDTLNEWELEELQARCDARGVRDWDALARRTIKRSAADAAGLHALCEWLQGHNLDVLCTFTFTNEVARDRGIYSLNRAIKDVARGLRYVDLAPGYRRGFENRFVLAGEWHPSGRTIPHVHGVLESGSIDPDKLCRMLFPYFLNTSGRCRFEPMRDVDTATLYGLKDTLKASQHEPDALWLKLSRKRSNSRSRGRAS